MRAKGDTDSLPTRTPEDKNAPLYVSFAGAGRAAALKQHRLADEPFVVRDLAAASYPGVGFDGRGYLDGVSGVRAGFNRWDRAYWRPEETGPVEFQDIIAACQAIYRRIGFIRNVIDLMADFASDGFELVHPVRSQQQFYQAWAKKVNLAARVNDFMKLALRDANVIVRRRMAKIDLGTSRDMAKGIDEKPEVIKKTRDRRQPNRTIPWRYLFISPTIVEKTGGDLAKFFGGEGVAVKLPARLANAINSPKTQAEKDMVAKLPAEVVAAAKAKNRLMPLDPERIYVAHYKKDDWDAWATPFLYGILDDVMFKDKMRLADISALDGVINIIRVWKLGDHTKEILPSKAAVSKLISILENNTGGGPLDLVWDSMIDLQVEVPPIDKILGPEKYTSVDADIVRGLGIPDSLLGGSGGKAPNAQSAFIQLKTIVQRLEYVREMAIGWLTKELEIVAKAMGFTMPTIMFGTMALRDEAAEKQLIIQLLDRGVISVESVVKAFGHDFLVELERLREENQIRSQEPPILERADPYHRPFSLIDKQTESQIKVVEAQGKLQPAGGGGGTDNPMGDQPRRDGTPSGPGRPFKKPSTNPRKQRTPKTLSTVYQGMAEDVLDEIDAVLDPLYLEAHKIANVRQATAEQRKELEQIKWVTLCCVRPGDAISQKSLAAAVDKSEDLSAFNDVLDELMADFERLVKRKPNVRDRRRLMASAWALKLTEGE